jgi:hypothetical protein
MPLVLSACLLQELGFRVLEVNPGQDRAGAHILKAIGEATQSRRLADAAPAAAAAAGKGAAAGTAAAAGGQAGRKGRAKPGAKPPAPAPARGCKRLAAVLEEQEDAGDSEPAPAAGARRGGKKQATPVARQQQAAPAGPAPALGAKAQEALTLILFDEFDSLLEHDKGFLVALLALVQDSKRPILLVTNSPELRGPLAAAACLQLAFARPQEEELLRHLALVAAAEGCALGLPQLRSLLGACGRDTRRCLMALQLWGRAGPAPALQAAGAPQQQGQGDEQRQAPWALQPEQQQLFTRLAAAEARVAALAAACGEVAPQQQSAQQAHACARQQQLQAYCDALADAAWLASAAGWVQQQEEQAAAKKAAASAKRRHAMYALLGGAPPAAGPEPKRRASLPMTPEPESAAGAERPDAAAAAEDVAGPEDQGMAEAQAEAAAEGAAAAAAAAAAAQAGEQQDANVPGVLQPRQQQVPQGAGLEDSGSQPSKAKGVKGSSLSPWLGKVKGGSQAAEPAALGNEQAPAEAGSQAPAQPPAVPNLCVSPVLETSPGAAAPPAAGESQQADSAAEGEAPADSQPGVGSQAAHAGQPTPAEQQQQEQAPVDAAAQAAQQRESEIAPPAGLSYSYSCQAAAQDSAAQQLSQLSTALDALSAADLLAAPRDPCPSASWALPYSQHTAALLQAPLRLGQDSFSVVRSARAQLAAAGAEAGPPAARRGPPPGAAGHVRCALPLVVRGEEAEDGGALLEELQLAECVGLDSGEPRAGGAGSHGPPAVPQQAARCVLDSLLAPGGAQAGAGAGAAPDGASSPARLQLVQQLDEALVAICPSAGVAGRDSSLERLAWLARLCVCEARRELRHGRQAARAAGRPVRRVGRFEHYMQRLVPGGVAAETVVALRRFGGAFEVAAEGAAASAACV